MRRASVVEFLCVGIEGKVDAQRRADNGDLCDDIAFASICIALFADSALDLRRSLRSCGECVFEDGIAFFDYIVRKRIFLCKSEALARGFLCHNFVIIELFAERRVEIRDVFFVRHDFVNSDLHGTLEFFCGQDLRLVHFLKSRCAGKSDRLVAESAIVVCAAHIAVIADAIVPFLLVEFCLQCNFVHCVICSVYVIVVENVKRICRIYPTQLNILYTNKKDLANILAFYCDIFLSQMHGISDTFAKSLFYPHKKTIFRLLTIYKMLFLCVSGFLREIYMPFCKKGF